MKKGVILLAGKLIGIDIGGTKCAVVLGGLKNGCPVPMARQSFSTADYPTPERALEQLSFLIEEMTGGEWSQYEGIGISCGGPLNSQKGLILSPPNLPGWDAVPICRFFEERLHLPAFLQNDANACAMAEWKYGAGMGCKNMIFLTFGTGLGAGLILNGQLYTGADDLAGEAGHIRLAPFGPVGYGKSGSFEGFCSGGGIARLARIMAEEKKQMGDFHPFCAPEADVSAKSVFSLAREGDALCRAVCETVGTYLGKGLSILIDLLNPDAVVIGSIYARNEDMLRPIAEQTLKAECLTAAYRRCALRPAALGEQIGDIAALTVAMGTPSCGYSVAEQEYF